MDNDKKAAGNHGASHGDSPMTLNEMLENLETILLDVEVLNIGHQQSLSRLIQHIADAQRESQRETGAITALVEGLRARTEKELAAALYEEEAAVGAMGAPGNEDGGQHQLPEDDKED
ncbi:MAG: hypothetical protein FWG91_03800 [Lachnospiraceae bacterium]|nr:hypothetical protein [Lachnospiraceae bacterium]